MAAERRRQGRDEDDVTPQRPSVNDANEVSDKLPTSPPYDLRLTVVGASNIAIADLRGTSDPYIIGKLKNVKGLIPEVGKASRIHFRTSTKAKTRDPEWRETWRFGGVREGTYIKLKLFDEDGKQAVDDKLGSIKLVLRDFENNLLDGLEHTRHIPIRGYKGKKHIQVLTAFFDLCNPEAYMDSPEPHITINLQLLPPTYPSNLLTHLVSPTRYSVHYSPLANLVTTTPSKKKQNTSEAQEVPPDAASHPSTSFKAYKIALVHPPPSKSLQFHADMSHSKAFDPSKLHYRFFRHLVRKQYQNIYGHDNNTVYGAWDDSNDVGQGLVDLLQPVENKLFTFVITTNGEWRFCETGDEYKINHLSKHGMHSNGEEKVAWSGEFFIRFDRDVTVEDVKDAKMYARDEEQAKVGGEKANIAGVQPQGRWKIYLDNDSGTYSPDKEKIATFREFMAQNLKGIEVVVKNFKDEGLMRAKKEQKGEDADSGNQVKGKNTEDEQHDQNKPEGKEEGVQGEPANDEPDNGQPATTVPKRKPRRLISILKEENERRLNIEREQAQKERRARRGSNYSSDPDENPY
ncbi:hypothetical protein AOL_s00076g518 [Orbilia oligospora ATCC 24927]|uniref:C2 domain-containing protein n=2 Tax=Orbilia oligospora TaxID=2813651 RepID=G1XA60_ARTOA|nr:hypothetical protein AOL_s00076g518 [Orbilia oligospora ATCC 24927]EGX49877.1 hypothetical protein AOL_s00076g518 [Orbilia oligospora ATCC 24927]KAF3276124.1 hypothetical protein TWF970_006409 [Orbilia oligospora]